MAQVDSAVSQSNFQVEISTDGSSWTDISGAVTSVATSGHEQQIGSINTADGDGAIVTASQKYAPVDVTVNIVYTEDSNDPFDRVMDAWESANKVLYMRYAPKGGSGTVVGNALYTLTDANGTAMACPIVSALPPSLDASTGDPAICTFTLRAPKISRGTTTT